jgi:hypothetical protein
MIKEHGIGPRIYHYLSSWLVKKVSDPVFPASHHNSCPILPVEGKFCVHPWRGSARTGFQSVRHHSADSFQKVFWLHRAITKPADSTGDIDLEPYFLSRVCCPLRRTFTPPGQGFIRSLLPSGIWEGR